MAFWIKAVIAAAGVTSLLYYLAKDPHEADAVARQAGFIDEVDRRRAEKLGFTDSERWAATKDAVAELTRNPAGRMRLSAFEWRQGGFGAVGVVSGIVHNDNDFAVRDVTLVCEFNAPSGTLLSEKKATLYETIGKSGRKAFKSLNVGSIHPQAARASCEIRKADRAL